MPSTENSWFIRRIVGGRTITVKADWLEGSEEWGLMCKVNGVPADMERTDDPHPLKEARRMIEAEIMNADEEETEALTATVIADTASANALV